MRNYRTILSVMALVVPLLCLPAVLWAVPGVMSYQGKLNDRQGNPINGSRTVTITIYDAADGGNILWTDTQSLNILNGILNVELGSPANPISESTFVSNNTYLGIKVGSDSEMTPRQKITSSAFAIKSPWRLKPLNAMDLTDNTTQSTTSTNYVTVRTLSIGPKEVSEYGVIRFNLRAFANTPNYAGETNAVTPYARICIDGMQKIEITGPVGFQQFSSGSATRVESFGLTGVYAFKYIPSEHEKENGFTIKLELRLISSAGTGGAVYNDSWEIWGN